MVWFDYSCLFAVWLHGGGLLAESIQMIYQDANSLPEGVRVQNFKNLFIIRVPTANLYLERNSNIVEFHAKGEFSSKYGVFTKPNPKLPEAIVDDLEATQSWLIDDFLESKSRPKESPQLLFTEQRMFKGYDALYFEAMYPAIITKTRFGIRIDRSNIGLANLIFFGNDHLYWLYYIGSLGSREGIKFDITDTVRSRFDTFLTGFEFVED